MYINIRGPSPSAHSHLSSTTEQVIPQLNRHQQQKNNTENKIQKNNTENKINIFKYILIFFLNTLNISVFLSQTKYVFNYISDDFRFSIHALKY